MNKKIFLIILMMTVFAVAGFGQSTEITYQGQLQSSSAPASGNFDFEFLLFDSQGGVSQIGSTITRSGVAVANGIFSVNLDFGASFPGANRYLEIHVRQSSVGGTFTTLAPRQSVTSAPYSVKSLSADTAANAANATNSVNATNATNAVTAANFTGNLNGDVTGTQSATAVTRLQGRDVSSTAPLGGQVLKFNNTTNQWIPDTDIVGSGGGGGTITGVTPGTGLTGGGASGNVTLNIANGGVGTAQLADNNVTDAKINTVSGGKVTGTVANAANAANATNATNAVNATNLTGNLTGDVTGTQSATVVTTVGGQSAANIANAVQSINTATANNTPNTLVRRDGSGNFIAGTITGNLTGNASTATNAATATTADTATNALSLGGVAANQYLQTNGNGSGLTNLNAGNITTGTLSNARLGQIPTANIADSAVTSPKIAGGQVVKSVNALKDDLTLAAGSNITITPAGNTLTIASTSGGVGGSGMPNRIPLWNGVGTTIGDSAITQNGNGVQLPNGVQLGVGAQGNNVAFGSPNGETGMTIAGASGRADVRFDGATLKLVAGGGGLVPSSTNGIAIDTQGLVGIGTNTPQAKLAVNAGGSGGEVRFSAPSGESGMSIVGTNRADVRFDGQTLKLLAGPGTGAMASTNGININGLGNVGIGTTTPAHRLSLIGGPPWTSFAFTGALELGNASAIGWRANAAGNRFGIGQTTGGLTFFATLSDPGTIASPANYVMVITDTGNITQPINNNGLVKAMIYVNTDGTIARCYNGITNSSTGNCGFSITRQGQGSYVIDFMFQVSNRFYTITSLSQFAALPRIGQIHFLPSANQLNIITQDPRNGDIVDDNFMIIVY